FEGAERVTGGKRARGGGNQGVHGGRLHHAADAAWPATWLSLARAVKNRFRVEYVVWMPRLRTQASSFPGSPDLNGSGVDILHP
ncbi:hypothetical protein, partial [Polaromonas sp.]|uniref:hypothetical protein n=1 Tax=Polaromonas sp. TaxID=1869339 RepID=UPI003CC64E3B